MASEPCPSTSSEYPYMYMSADVFNFKYKETLHIISRVVQECQKDMSELNPPSDDYLERASRYTGFDRRVLEKYADSEYGPHVLLEYKDFLDRYIVHEELLNFYLNKRIMPTTKQLYDALLEKIPPYIDMRNFRKRLVKMGYLWKEITPYGLVVTENPAVTYERYNYLKKMKEYRLEERPIYFVDLRCESGKKIQLAFLYAVSKYSIEAIETHNSRVVSDLDFKTWLQSNLLPIVPPNSVIVLHNDYYNNQEIIKIPTIDSLKVDMIEWLEYNNVPCNRSLSKTELYTLVEKYTNVNEKLYKIDVIIKNQGHEVLRVPECIKKVTPTYLVTELVNNNLRTKNTEDLQSRIKLKSIIFSILQDIPRSWLKKYDSFIAEQEKIVFENDMKVDSFIDDLYEAMKHLNITAEPDSDLPSCSDSE